MTYERTFQCTLTHYFRHKLAEQLCSAMHYAVEVPKINYWSHVFIITDLCILVYGVVSKSLILINKTYVSVVNLHYKHTTFAVLVLVLVLVLEPQVLDNNTEAEVGRNRRFSKG